MLSSRRWKPVAFETQPGPVLYTFLLTPKENLGMTSIGVSSESLHVLPWNSENSEWVYPEQQVARVLVELFKEIPQVKSICARFGHDEITIWTLLASYDREAREKVYEKELEVCKILRIYDFDFRATSADLVSPEELALSGSREIFRRN